MRNHLSEQDSLRCHLASALSFTVKKLFCLPCSLFIVEGSGCVEAMLLVMSQKDMVVARPTFLARASLSFLSEYLLFPHTFLIARKR